MLVPGPACPHTTRPTHTSLLLVPDQIYCRRHQPGHLGPPPPLLPRSNREPIAAMNASSRHHRPPQPATHLGPPPPWPYRLGPPPPWPTPRQAASPDAGPDLLPVKLLSDSYHSPDVGASPPTTVPVHTPGCPCEHARPPRLSAWLPLCL
jgi:hypothetical protein